MIKEYFAKHVQALQTGCLLHMCHQVQAKCCKFGDLKGYFQLKFAYMQADATGMQYLLSEKRERILQMFKKRKLRGTFKGDYKVPLKVPLYNWI